MLIKGEITALKEFIYPLVSGQWQHSRPQAETGCDHILIFCSSEKQCLWLLSGKFWWNEIMTIIIYYLESSCQMLLQLHITLNKDSFKTEKTKCTFSWNSIEYGKFYSDWVDHFQNWWQMSPNCGTLAIVLVSKAAFPESL